MNFETFKLNKKKMSAIERLIAIVEQEIITNKNKYKKTKKAKNENNY